MNLRPAVFAFAAASLLVASPCVPAPPPSGSRAEPVEVVLTNFDFTPSTIAMVHGMNYALVLSNRAGGGHNFAAPAFFAAAQVDSADRSLINGGTVEVPGGRSVTIHLVAPAAGRYKVRCTHTFHTMFGMKGAIVVT
jgi:uncharacterized cupredoxin-like copper-binding protein